MSLARGLADLRAENGAREFEITLVTQTPREDFDDSALPFPVVRQPGFWRLMRLMRGADVVHLAGPALGPLPKRQMFQASPPLPIVQRSSYPSILLQFMDAGHNAGSPQRGF